MYLNINTQNITLSGELRNKIRAKFALLLQTDQHKIQSIQLTLTDINGPKGGQDKQCQIRLNLSGIPSILISQRQSSMSKAFSCAYSKLTNTLRRKLSKAKSFAPVNRSKPFTLENPLDLQF
jgi:putative sigma-54 modulation protein